MIFAKAFGQTGIITTDTIEYSVSISNPENNNSYYLFYKENIEVSKRRAFLDSLFYNIYLNKICIFDYKSGSQIAWYETWNIGSYSETFASKLDPTIDSTVTSRYYLPATISAIIFKEIWQIDTINHTITKEILAYCPVADIYNFDENRIKQEPLFWIKNIKTDSLNEQTLTEKIEYKIGSNQKFRNTDILIPDSITKRVNLVLLEKARKYKNSNYYDINNNLILLSSDSNLKSFISNTITFLDAKKEDLDYLTFEESWSFDSKNFSITKKINGISCAKSDFEIDIMTNEINFKGVAPLFYIKM